MNRTESLRPSLLNAWHRRFTIRTRLTVAFTTLVGLAGVGIVFIVTLFMRTVPTYMTVSAREGEYAKGPLGAATEGGDIPADGIVLSNPAGILNTSLVVSVIVLIILVGAGAFVAWVISGKMLQPLQVINSAAQRASTGALDHRVALQGPKDELHDLSTTFDMMLSRLEDAFQAHQRFAANASHELRTPLAAIETMLEVALSDPAISASDLRVVAEKVLASNRRNTETVEALLALTEVGARPLDRAPVELATLVRDVVSHSRAEADRANINMTLTARDADVAGEEALIRQAVTNIVTNAIRHNHDDGVVEITVAPAHDHALIRVESSGAVLTNERISELREPFARGAGRIETGRRGHGLGLTIATTIIDSHGGRLSLAPRHGGGLVALMAFPRLVPAPPQGAPDASFAIPALTEPSS